MGGILCPNLYIKHDESTPKRQSIVYHKYESDKLSEFSSNVFTLKKVTFSPIIETRNYDIDENNSNSVYYSGELRCEKKYLLSKCKLQKWC